MNQYLLILVWVLFLGVFKTKQQGVYWKNDKLVYRKPSKAYCFLLVFPLILSAAFRTTFGDQGYKIAFRAWTLDFEGVIFTIRSGVKGPGYYVIEYIGNLLFGNNAEIFFFVIAALQMYSLMRLYRRYSLDIWVAVFIFVASTDYLSWMQNGIRQFIAVTLILFFSDWIFEKKIVRICVVILLAASIHSSALIMLPIVFVVQGKAFNWKTILAIIGTVVVLGTLRSVIPVVDTLLTGTEYSGAITDWQESGNDGVNYLRVLVYSVPTFLSVLGYRAIRQSEDKVIHITCNMSIISTLLYIMGMFTSGIYVGRLPIYCSLYANGILLPWVIQRVFSRNTSKIIYVVMIMSYIVFYYYQTHVIWGII